MFEFLRRRNPTRFSGIQLLRQIFTRQGEDEARLPRADGVSFEEDASKLVMTVRRDQAETGES